MPLNYYTERLESLNKNEQQLRSKLKVFGLFRLIVFIAIFLSIFVLVPKNSTVGLFIAGVLVILFFILIKKHHNISAKYKHIKALIRINENEIQAQQHSFSSFADGEEFTDHSHPYSYDMDLFGAGSLFQYISRTVTAKGKKHLADLFRNTNLDPESIIDSQESIKELTQKIDYLQDFCASGSLHADTNEDIELLRLWIKKPPFYLTNRFFPVAAKLLPSLAILSLLLSPFISSIWGLFLIVFLAQLFIVSTRYSHTSKEHSLIGKRLDALKKYTYLLEIIESYSPKSKTLKQITGTLLKGEFSAADSIKKLSKIVSSFDNRQNILAAIFLEGTFLWDIQCMIRLEKWKSQQGKHFEEWIDAIAHFDALSCLSIFAFNHPSFSFPEFTEEPVISTRNMGHVLIPPNQRVSNDFIINRKTEFIIITGANMAGKSTFLRTIATNMILAMTGAPVCAENFICCPMPIFSSMRTSDSLNKNESYFYAELKRLKEMLDKLRSGENLFIILDEILKGTNSKDKQKGSKAALEQILKLKGTGIIATHDLELAQIETKYPERIRNKCFEIDIDQAKISFDYKLQNGITTKMNASILMHQMGIISD